MPPKPVSFDTALHSIAQSTGFADLADSGGLVAVQVAECAMGGILSALRGASSICQPSAVPAFSASTHTRAIVIPRGTQKLLQSNG
jgi:hypothetical protein